MHPYSTTHSITSDPPLIEDARVAARAINHVMATWPLNANQVMMYRDQIVSSLELLNAQPDREPEGVSLWRASFRPTTGSAAAESMIFLVRNGVAQRTLGQLYFEHDLYPGTPEPGGAA